jgi:DNA gyrase subunit A
VIVSAVRATARGEVGVLTSQGRVLKLGVLDLPTLPATANDPHLTGGAPVSEFVSLGNGERVLGLTSFAENSLGLAVGTKQGIVKRVNPEYLAAKDEWDYIALKDGDEVIGALELTDRAETLCFITTDAQLLHFTAESVRPQGRAGGGIAGIRLSDGAHVAWFGAVSDDAVVVTASGSSTALPGTEAGSVKVTPFTEYPPKGRGTGGVRCHRMLKGEDTLVFAWAGEPPARAAAASGAAVDLPELDPRRDGSGVPVAQPLAACAAPVALQLGTPAPTPPVAG